MLFDLSFVLDSQSLYSSRRIHALQATCIAHDRALPAALARSSPSPTRVLAGNLSLLSFCWLEASVQVFLSDQHIHRCPRISLKLTERSSSSLPHARALMPGCEPSSRPFPIPYGSEFAWSADSEWERSLLNLIKQLPHDDAAVLFQRAAALSKEEKSRKERLLTRITDKLFVVGPPSGSNGVLAEEMVEVERQKLAKKVRDHLGRYVTLSERLRRVRASCETVS